MNGRNVVALAGTYAGVTAIRASQDTSDGRQGPIMSVNGGNTNHNLFTLNGAIFTHFNQTTGFNPPPPDAIQEIRIQTHNFSAEDRAHRRQPGEHRVEVGDERVPRHALEFHRNSALNAEVLPDSEAHQDENQQWCQRRRRDHSYNKVFWFGAYQRLWDRSEAGQGQTIVPTDAQRTGDFTALSTSLRNPVNPITSAPFTDSSGAPCVSGNIIRAGCISPVSGGC